MDQWSKTTSYLKRDSDTLQHGELRSYCGSRLVKFVLWIFINFKDTYETGESSSSSSSPTETKLLRKHKRSLQQFLEPDGKSKVIYTDNSLEFGKACEDLSWNHCTSTPHRSETDGIAERAVRRVKEGTSAVLLQSGLNENWWADSMECYTYLRNIQDLLSDGKTPYERRFGQPFKGPIVPFGSLVEYYPISAKDQSRIHQFGKKESLTWIVPRIRTVRGENLEG